MNLITWIRNTFSRQSSPGNGLSSKEARVRNEIVEFEEDTKPLKPFTDKLGTPQTKIRLTPLQLLTGCAQSVGKQRDHNEDALFCLSSIIAYGDTNLPFGLYIVADGMGGHQHGEVASEKAIRAMTESISNQLLSSLFSMDPHPPEQSLQEILRIGFERAHQAVTTEVSGGGTTLTAVLILGSQMSIAHIGDSRVYYIDPIGQMKALTRDHSLVKRLVELGQLTLEEAAVHPQRNVLYRALGQGELSEPEIISAPLPESGSLLICSDGLWGVISEQEIGHIAVTSPTQYDACQEMIKAANLAGGPDNITAILTQLPVY